MAEDLAARSLHDKATRGNTLTEAEQARLAAWYEQQDNEENALLESSTPQTPTTLQSLRSDVEAALSRLLMVTQHIQTLTEENEALRHDIAVLHQQLAEATLQQAA